MPLFSLNLRPVATLSLGLLFSVSLQAKAAESYQFVRSNVLGTSFEMTVQAPAEQAKLAEHKVLAEIERLALIFSTYDKTSEVSLLNQTGHPNQTGASQDFLTLVKHCETWQKTLPKSFSCRLGNVIEMWQGYEQQQLRPERIKIREQARKAQQSTYSVQDLSNATANSDFTWNFGGIAKGYILDQAMKVAKASATQAQAIKLDIGGDGVYWQSPQASKPSWRVGLALPKAIDDSQAALLGTLELSNGALAYSGHNSRARQIGRRSYSHILAPRDGWPTHNPVTAIVKAPDATSADALATALAASEISVALDWLAKHPEYAALLIDNEGRQYASNNWYQGYVKADTPNDDFVEDYQARISFSLPKLSVAKYRRPYAALWVADQKGKVVRNLLVLGQSERWMQKNRSWWRLQGRTSSQLLDGFARPTRRPGKYDVIWNGRDDFGQQLPVGEYRLFAEVAREHGKREKLSLPFKLGNQTQSLRTNGKEEIGVLAFKSAAKKKAS